MNQVIAAIARRAATRPGATALDDGSGGLGWADLHGAVSVTAGQLRARTSRAVALALDNGPAWVVADLALLAARLPCVPLPGFFSPQQMGHAVRDAGVECIITDDPEKCLERVAPGVLAAVRDADVTVCGRRLGCIRVAAAAPAALPAGTLKVTYTSGTTGNPRGVCLGGDALAAVAASLASACRLGAGDRHLSILPLATLLENVGVYASLLAGACCALPPLAEIGFQGASGARADLMTGAMEKHRATTAIIVPQLLRAIVARLAAGTPAPGTLRFLAVGGATVAPGLLAQAARLGLPVYEGYGLSECASVLSLNTPDAHRVGSVGRPLPHVTIEIAPDGEVIAGGATLLGYSDGERGAARWATGDIGHLDAEGFLYLDGRKKDIFITSYGRNVSPAWIEAALLAEPGIAQAWVHGESRPWNCAVVTPGAGWSGDGVDAAIARVNTVLPEYARVRKWIPSRAPFACDSGELTANGRLRREVLASRYRHDIAALYEKEHHELS